MMPFHKKYLMTMMFVLLSVGIADDMAFVVPVTIDGMEDAGQYLMEEANPGIVDININNVPHPVSADTADWNFRSDFDSFATVINIPYWFQEESVGNTWSSDQFVGDSLSGLSGTYRIALLSGAFESDSLNLSNWQGWRWEMDVKAIGDSTDILDAPPSDGSNGGYDTSEEGAYKAVSGYYYHDFDTAEGGGDGSFNFSINDLNSMNNFGNLTFTFAKIPEPNAIEFAKVPEPATILILVLGLMGIPGIRRFIK